MKYLAYLLLFLLVLTSVSAFPFDFRVKPVNDTVFPDEQAVFLITVYNSDTESKMFEVNPDAISWVGTVTPQPVEVPGFGSRLVTVNVKPKSTVQPGSHGIPIKLTDLETKKSLTKSVPVYIKPFDSRFGRYLPSVALGADITPEVDPRDKAKVALYLRNRNSLDITALEIKITTDLFYKEVSQPLGPLMEHRDEYLFDLDPLQEPGTYDFLVEIMYDGQRLSKVTKSFEVLPYVDVAESTDVRSGIFRTDTSIVVSNGGNSLASHSIAIPDNPFTSIFTSFSEEPLEQRIDGKNMLVWDLDVEPQGSVTLEVKRNYQLGVALLVLILVALITYFVTRSPIILIKEAHEELLDSGEPVIKVRILVKNRSNKPFYKVRIRDRIPPIADVFKKAHVGTLQPNAVLKDRGRGTIIKWELDVLEPQEERLVAYVLSSRLKIVGGFKLRPARLTYQFGDRERIVRSNIVMVRAK